MRNVELSTLYLVLISACVDLPVVTARMGLQRSENFSKGLLRDVKEGRISARQEVQYWK